MTGSFRKITVVGDPVLSTPTREVTSFDAELSTLVEDMFASMAVAEGVGLAAPQVGVDLAVFVYDCPDESGHKQRGHVVNPPIDHLGRAGRGRRGLPLGSRAVPRARALPVGDGDRGGRHGRAGHRDRNRLLRTVPAARDRPPQGRALHRPPAPQPPPAGAARDGAVRLERSVSRTWPLACWPHRVPAMWRTPKA